MNEPGNVNEFFDSNVEDYEAKHYGRTARSFMTVRQVRALELVDALKLPRGAAVLDAGCGPGYLLEQLARRGFRAHGMDGSEGMLRATDARLRAAKLEFDFELKVGDIEHLPFPDQSFDLVCSTGVIEYLATDTQVLADMARVLKPGGRLVLSVTNLWSPVNYLDFFVEFLKRRAWVRSILTSFRERRGQGPVLPRHFRVRRHRPGAFRHAIRQAGFRLDDAVYFYFLPWPRPFDQLFPKASAALGAPLERFGRSMIGPLAEGYLISATKLDRADKK